jgi:hypothetical protein
MKANAFAISPVAIFSPAITTAPAETHAVEQRGSRSTFFRSSGVWIFRSSSRETGSGSYNRAAPLSRIGFSTSGKSDSRVPTVKKLRRENEGW